MKPLAGAAKDGLVAAAIALMLGWPLIGLRLVDQASGEGLATRWPDLAASVGLVALGRFGLSLIATGAVRTGLAIGLGFALAAVFIRWPTGFLEVVAVGGALLLALSAALSSAPPRSADRAAQALKPAARLLPLLLIGVALALPVFAGRGLLDAGTLIMTYVTLGWGLNIVTGLAGLLDLGYVAFIAIGAYTTSILFTRFGFTFWECLPLAALTASAAGILLGFPVLRLRGDYFAIVTLGFGQIVRIVATNWRSLTGGSEGIGVPKLTFFGIADFTANPAPGHIGFSALFGIPYAPTQRLVFLYYIVLAVALAVNLFTTRIRRLPIGRAWEALREDEIATEALGIDRRRVKLAAFAIGAAWGGLGGAFVAARLNFVTPDSFLFMESITVTAIVVLGGLGSQLGIVLAAIVMIGAPELFRVLAEYRMLAFGAAMIAIMRFRPQGLIATRRPTVSLE